MTTVTASRTAKPGDTLTLKGPNNHVVTITMDSDRRWWDLATGVEYGLADEALMVDTSDKPGAGAISFAAYKPLVDAAKPHDFAFSSVAYQVVHTREEADKKLGEDTVALGAPSWFGRVVTWVVDKVDSGMWDNIKTRWKNRAIDEDLDPEL